MIVRNTHKPSKWFDELIVDHFAGGGGASLGMEMGAGRAVDIAVNHDPLAVAMHRANHPATRHLCQDVFNVDPVEAAHGRRVGLVWFSPDCTYHSKARGGKPIRTKKRRDLAWVVLRWAGRVRPRVIMLENVEEFAHWGPLTRKRGRDRHPRPCKLRRGETFNRFVSQLQGLGYTVEYKELRASDYGAPTIRKRLFLVARCDGQPIVWPEPTHGDGLLPLRTAADCIDFGLPCPSIFDRPRPLADNTLKRIAAGIMRYVVGDSPPFIVRLGQTGGNGSYTNSTADPLTTVTTKAEHCLVSPRLVATNHGDSGGRRAYPVTGPTRTVCASSRGGEALVAAFIARHYGGMTARPVDTPLPTTTTRGTQNQLVAAHLTHLYTSNTRGGSGDLTQPIKTVTAGGNHAGLVAAMLAPYYGSGSGKTGRPANQPAPTITTRGRLSLVTVDVQGETWVIQDIGMRMLQPRELFRAQGFPDSYVIDRGRGPDWEPVKINKTQQVHMCGNSVCPGVAASLVRANYSALETAQEASA